MPAEFSCQKRWKMLFNSNLSYLELFMINDSSGRALQTDNLNAIIAQMLVIIQPVIATESL